MKMRNLMWVILILGTACRTSDKATAKEPTPVAQSNPIASSTPVLTIPTQPSPITGAKLDKHILCQIRASDDRADYPMLDEEGWSSFAYSLQERKDRGYLCYHASGDSQQKLQDECLKIGQSLRKIPNDFPIKAFVLNVDATTFCKVDKFSSPNDRCTCSHAAADSYHAVVGNESFGTQKQSLCSASFDFCGIQNP